MLKKARFTLLAIALFTLSTVTLANSNPTVPATPFVERLTAAHLFLEASLPLVRELLQENLKAGFKGLEKNTIDKALETVIANFKENPLLLTTLTKYFTTQEMKIFAQFLSTKQALSVVKKISQQLASQNPQFQRDFERLGEEINAILDDEAL